MLQYDNLIEEFKSEKNPFKKYFVNKYPNKKFIRQMLLFFFNDVIKIKKRHARRKWEYFIFFVFLQQLYPEEYS